MPLKSALARLASGRELTVEEAGQAMHVLMQGKASPEQTAGLLLGLRSRGETLDELVTFTSVMREYAVRVRTVVAAELGLEPAPVEAIRGGDAADNAGIIRAILSGRRGPHRDVVVLNAAFGLVAAGIAADPAEGVRQAIESIDSGQAGRKLADLGQASHEVAAEDA